MKMLTVAAILMMSSVWANNCNVEYDQIRIPHVKSSSQEEMYYCLGYLHGHDRAWEMDYLRRVAHGRNAEVLGYKHLKGDLMMRLLDLPAKATELWRNFPESHRQKILRYVEGVNEGLKSGKSDREFIDLGYEPESWNPEDTLVVLLIQSFDQTKKTFFKDYTEEQAREEWGDKTEAMFDHDGVPWESTILKEGEYQKKKDTSKTTSLKIELPKLWGTFPDVFGKESGSNNWVISAKKSKTGKAILANDPHLDLKTPLFWYWVHLRSPDEEIIGASLPGVPLIATGTNGKVSWGLTNSYINTADTVFVKDLPEDEIVSLRPTVWIKFGFLKVPFFFKSFEKLKTGHPVLPLELKNDKTMVLRWSGFSLTGEDIVPMFNFSKVRNVTEMDEVLKKVGVPAWNFVFADTKGDIGYRMVGKSYRHTEKLPFGVSTMSMETFLKEEFLDPEERPHVLKPKRQYVYSANNRHWPSDALFYGGRGYSHSFRGYRLNELLQGKHDRESFKTIQCDRLVVDATFFVPKLLKLVRSDELEKWNMKSDDSSSALSLYRRFMDIMMEEWKVDEYALFRLLDLTSEKQKKEIDKFYQRAVLDVQGRGWGQFHRLGFTHLSQNEKWVFSPEMAGIGDNHTIDPGTSRWNEDRKIYEQFSGASMRMIIEMTERPKIHLVLPGFNRDYTSSSELTPWQDWKSCKYNELSF